MGMVNGGRADRLLGLAHVPNPPEHDVPHR